MWKLLSKSFFMILLFSLLGFGEDFERLCNEEVLKDDFNISVVKDTCLKTANKELKAKSFANASWYFLLAGKITKNINEVQTQITDNMFVNIGHSYLLQGKINNVSKYYATYIDKELQPNKAMLADFKLLQKLYPKKKKLLKKGLRIWNTLYKPLTTLDTLYTTYQAQEKKERYGQAINTVHKIIQLRLNYSKNKTEAISIDYNNLSLLYGENGNYRKALKYMLITLKIDKKLLNEEHHQIAVTYSNLGFIYEKLSKYKDAEKYHLLALKIFKNLYQSNNSSIAITYNNLAFLYSSIGKYNKALIFYQKALLIDRKNLQENYSTISITLNNLGELYSLLGDYPKAMRYYQDTLKVDIEHNGKDHTSVAHSYNNIAQIYELLEDYKRAKNHYDKALNIAQNKLPKKHPFLATIYANLGNLYYVMEEDMKSFQEHKKALEIRKALAKGEVSIDLALSYHAMGLLYQSSEDYNKSLEYFQKTLKINKKLFNKDNIANSVTYSSMGTVYQQLNNKEKALEFYLKALKLEKKILGKNHKDLARSYNSLSLFYFSQKNNKKAYEYIKKSFKIFNKNKNKNFTLLDNNQRINYTKNLDYYFNNLLYLINLNRNYKSFKFAINHWLNYKGTLFEYQNILSMIKSNPKTQKKLIESINKLNFLNNQLSNTKIKKNEKKIEKEIHKIEIKLSKQNDNLKSILGLDKIDSTKISNHLKPYQLYIDFAHGNDNYYIFTIDHKNHITFQQIDKNRTQTINQNIKSFRANTQKMADYLQEHKVEKIKVQSKKEAQKILTHLYDNIIKEYLEKQITNKTQLIISPDGMLNYLPFEALYHQEHYLIEKHTISYISSGKEFIRQTKISHQKAKYQMILFANANFDAIVKAYKPFQKKNVYRENNNTKEFTALGRDEIHIINTYYPNAIIFQDKNASIKNLMKISSTKILHLSTHGILLEDKDIMNPMQKSILIFAGANLNKQQSSISALKLSTLDLKETELVVLSACQSGLGDIHNAEGVVGLPKALLQAGAKNVIMSLWTVSNLKTTMLMDNFYANITKSQNYSQALQNSKIRMINMHPYYWSAFILSGFQNNLGE